jgi:hypothetical protein
MVNSLQWISLRGKSVTTTQRGNQPSRIPIETDLRNLLQEEKRGKENWSQLLGRIYTEWLECKREREERRP